MIVFENKLFICKLLGKINIIIIFANVLLNWVKVINLYTYTCTTFLEKIRTSTLKNVLKLTMKAS